MGERTGCGLNPAQKHTGERTGIELLGQVRHVIERRCRGLDGIVLGALRAPLEVVTDRESPSSCACCRFSQCQPCLSASPHL